jgi:hypothetical protein
MATKGSGDLHDRPSAASAVAMHGAWSEGWQADRDVLGPFLAGVE